MEDSTHFFVLVVFFNDAGSSSYYLALNIMLISSESDRTEKDAIIMSFNSLSRHLPRVLNKTQ
jgi:hypothetical protein